MLGVMEALFLCLRELVRSSGVATILLFQKTSQRFYYFGQSEKTILLFGVGRDYEFIDEEKGSGGSGVMRSMPC